MKYISARIRRWYIHHRNTQSGTVRYAFSALLVLSAVAAVVLSGGTSSSYVRIETKDGSITAGERAVISVYAYAHVPTNAIDIQISYPESQLYVEGIDTGESVITVWTEEPYAKNSTIHLRGGVYRKGFLGEHLIANIRVRAKESGTAKLFVSEKMFIAGDGKGTSVTLSSHDGERVAVNISESGELSTDVTIGLVTDINKDGRVDAADIQSFLSAWRLRNVVLDFNGDGKMTLTDFAIILAHSFFK